MTMRRLVTLAASAALHLAAVAVALVVAGAEGGSAVLVDLVIDVAGETSQDARPRRWEHLPLAGAHPTERARAQDSALPADRSPAPSPGKAALTPRDQGLTPPATAPEVTARANAEPPGEPAPAVGSTAARLAPTSLNEATGEAAHAVSAADHGAPSASVTMHSGSVGGTLEAEMANHRGGTGSLAAVASPGDGPGGIPPEYRPYLQRFRRRVQESVHYPLAARRQGLSGRLELEVLLEPSGQVSGVRLVSSSSHAVLDEAALVAVKTLSPEPFPEALPRRPLRIRLPLAFELQ